MPPRARGRCPRCGRTLGGRGMPGGKVALGAHKQAADSPRGAAWCISGAGHITVPRTPGDPQ